MLQIRIYGIRREEGTFRSEIRHHDEEPSPTQEIHWSRDHPHADEASALRCGDDHLRGIIAKP